MFFQGQTLYWPYLRNGWSDWHETKRKFIGWTLGDLDIVTFTFDLTHDLGLEFSRSNFEIALSQDHEPVTFVYDGELGGSIGLWPGWLQTPACHQHIKFSNKSVIQACGDCIFDPRNELEYTFSIKTMFLTLLSTTNSYIWSHVQYDGNLAWYSYQ